MRQAFAEFVPRILESFQFETLEYFPGWYEDDDEDPYGFPLRQKRQMQPLCPEQLLEFNQSYERLFDDTAPIYSALVKHAKQVPEAQKTTAFDKLLLPFLVKFCIWIGFEGGVPPRPFGADFVAAILDEYLNNYVRGPPARPFQWGGLLPDGCTCWDCVTLNTFLCDPRQQVRKFAMAVHRRQHLETRLRPLAGTLIITTIRAGSPHTLNVEKPTVEYAKHVAVREWDAKVNKASGYMSQLKENYAAVVMGPSRFQDLYLHPNLRKPDWVEEAVKLPNNEYVWQAPSIKGPWKEDSLAPRKRPFVDTI